MTAFRLFLIILIFCTVSVAWLILGSTVEYRTRDLTQRMGEEVDALWGPAGLVQEAPAPDPLKSDIQVVFDHEQRYKGLVWFSTYAVEFTGTYTVQRPANDHSADAFIFPLPSGAPDFENLTVKVNGDALDVAPIKAGGRLMIPLPAAQGPHTVAVTYRTYGRDRWVYDLSRGGEFTTMVRDFRLAAITDFTAIDYPKGSVSPTPEPAQAIEGGMQAEWKFENRSTRRQIGIEMPSRQNAGAVAGRMAFAAPVSLFFFFTVLFTVIILKKVTLHPMHYLFISAGFFAFHILMAYLVDRIPLDYVFWICAVVSVLLVVSYMRLVAGVTFAVLYVGLAQLVYLVGFSYAFTWQGNTGLTITIAAIATLFVLMQATGRLDWNEVFKKPPAPPRQPPAAAAPAPSGTQGEPPPAPLP